MRFRNILTLLDETDAFVWECCNAISVLRIHWNVSLSKIRNSASGSVRADVSQVAKIFTKILESGI